MNEWFAYDQLEPFGEGRLVLLLANLIRMNAADRDLTPTDLVPYYIAPPPPPREEVEEAQRRDVASRMATFFKRRAGVG